MEWQSEFLKNLKKRHNTQAPNMEGIPTSSIHEEMHGAQTSSRFDFPSQSRF